FVTSSRRHTKSKRDWSSDVCSSDLTDEKVIALCHQAKTPVGNTAAICIYPRFIPIARKTLKEQGTPEIRIATVTNFPHGNDDIRSEERRVGKEWRTRMATTA